MTSQFLARTVEIAPVDLLSLLPNSRPFAWVRRGEGIIGWGEVARFTTSGPSRFADAEAAFRAWLAGVRIEDDDAGRARPLADSGEGKEVVAGNGVTEDDVAVAGTGPVAFGSFAFDSLADCETSMLVVPQVVVGRKGSRSWITVIHPADDPLDPRDCLELNVDSPRSPGAVTEADGSLNRAAWLRRVQSAVDRVQDGELDKVVIARDVAVRTERPIDPRWLLARLGTKYSDTWTFCVDGLVGATPEMLVRLEKGLVASRVLAGTVHRGGASGAAATELATELDNSALLRAAQLARSAKNQGEHEHAVISVTQVLEPLCESMNVPDHPFVLHLPNVMHLATDVTGILRRRAGSAPSSLQLAAALHPSAAVCGTPRESARAVIRELEGMDRGRYSSPVGWMGANGDGEWGIALRCARLSDSDPHLARLFAGCGIVAQSNPSDELAESEAKLAPMRWALAE